MIIKGNTVGTPTPRTNYEQTDPTKADYLKGKEVLDQKIADAKKAGTDAQTMANNAQVAANAANAAANQHFENQNNPHGVTASQVGAAPASHATDKDNPHGVTAAQVGARPDTWMPTAADVGARPDTWIPTPQEIGAAIGNGYLPAGTDLNKITACGVYRVNSATNCPDPCNYGQLLVMHGASDTVAQIIFDHSDSRMFVRSGNPGKPDTGAWGDWVEVCTTGNNMKLLWENASPGSEFLAQWVQVDLSKYRFIMLEYFITGTSYLMSRILEIGVYTKITESDVHYEEGSDILCFLYRTLTTDRAGVSFGDGYHRASNSVVSNNMIKPVKIYGII